MQPSTSLNLAAGLNPRQTSALHTLSRFKPHGPASPQFIYTTNRTCSLFCYVPMSSSQGQKPPLSSNPSQAQRSQPGLRYPTSGKTIYHRPLGRSRTSELSQASFAYLFGEMVGYAQKRVTGIQDLEKRCQSPVTPYLSKEYQTDYTFW